MSVHVVGSLHLDVIVTAQRLPRLDETLAGEGVAYRFGGKGGNQAVAAARAGARVTMAGAVGTDAFAATLLSGLDAAGIDRGEVALVSGASGMSVAIVDARGDYGAVIVSAANLAVDGAGTPPPDTTHLLLQNEIPEAANLAAARTARAAGLRVILNAAPARPLPPELLRLTDILVVNRGEAAALTGLPDDAPAVAARGLKDLGPKAVIVTLGAGGLHALTGEGAVDLPARQVAVVSTHGAGDVFVGTLAARLDAGDGLRPALDAAQEAAARHVAAAPPAPGPHIR